MTGVGTSNCRRRGWSSVGSRAPRFSARGSGPWDGRVSSSGVVFHPIRRLGRPGFRSYALSKACGHWGFCPLCTRRGFLLVAVVRPGDTSVTLLPKAQRTVGSGLRWRAEAEQGIRKLTGAWFLPAWTCPALHGEAASTRQELAVQLGPRSSPLRRGLRCPCAELGLRSVCFGSRIIHSLTWQAQEPRVAGARWNLSCRGGCGPSTCPRWCRECAGVWILSPA